MVTTTGVDESAGEVSQRADRSTDETETQFVPSAESARPRRARHRRGNVLAVVTVVLIVALVGHRWVPSVAGLGLLWESLLPWTAVLFVLALLGAAIRRSARAALWAVVGLAVWSVMFVPSLLDRTPAAAAGPSMRFASQNVGASNADAGAAAAALVATKADVVAVQELSATSAEDARDVLDATYSHSATASTVEVWSRYPLTDVTKLDLGMAWDRTLHATLGAPDGDVSLYVVHMPSVRPGMEAARNRALQALSAAVSEDRAERVVVVGDLNTAPNDRNLRDLLVQLDDSRASVGGGFGFTWPAGSPVVRPDHILTKGFTVTSDDVGAAHGSDHRPIVATVRF